jgi:MFS family permease
MAEHDERHELNEETPGEIAEPKTEASGQAAGETAEGADAEELSLLDNFKILFGASKGFWLVNQVNFLDGIAYFGILHLLTLFIRMDVGLSTSGATVAVSTFTGLVTLFMFGGGFISDWLGVRKAMTVVLLMMLAGRVLLVSSPIMGSLADIILWVALLIMALGTGVLQPALYAGVKEYSDPRTATIGYSLLYSIMNLGIVAEAGLSPLIRQASRPEIAKTGEVVREGFFEGSFLGPLVNPENGIGGVYIVLVGITALMLVLHVLFFTKKVEHEDRTVTYDPNEKHESGRDKTVWDKIKELPFLDSRFIFFIFILLPVRTLFAHQFLTIPDYIVRAYPEAVGHRLEWFQGLNPLIIVIFVPLIAAFTRKVNIVTMMIIGTSISALTTFILVPGPGLTRLILYVILFSFGEAVWSSRFLEYVANLAPAGKVGAYMGLAGIPWFLAKATTGWYAGSMLDTFLPVGNPAAHNSGTMWLIYAFIALITPIGLIIGKRWVEKGIK